jgi:hypothetical protein
MEDKMKNLKVDEEIIMKATLCHKDFSCQKGYQPCCSVNYDMEDGILFITKESCHCFYNLRFGIVTEICTCPVRREIFRLYNK